MPACTVLDLLPALMIAMPITCEQPAIASKSQRGREKGKG
jgi:hypothetical protein